MKLVSEKTELPNDLLQHHEIVQKLSAQTSSKPSQSQTQELPYTNGVAKSSCVSAESGFGGDSTAMMNDSEGSKYDLAPADYQQVTNGVKPGISGLVDENSNPTLATAPVLSLDASEEVATVIAAEPAISLPKLSGPELIEQLKRQLEYYFSKENLPKDPYLMSQMDSESYAPIWMVANFNAVKKLTDDIIFVKEAIKSSTMLQMDEKEERVRPNDPRCIVILREIPGSTPVETVRELFNSDSCPEVLSCEFAGGSCWYVTFANEPDAQAAYRHLRENVVVFLNNPIMARIKSKSHFLNSYPRPAPQTKPDVPAVQQVPQTPTGQQQADPHAAQAPQQLSAQTVDFGVAQQQVVYTPHLPGGATHPVSQMSMPTPPPFIARVSPSPVPTANAQGQPGATMNHLGQAQFNLMMPWQVQPHGAFYSPDQILGQQFPYLYKQAPTQPNLQTSTASNKPNQFPTHRFSDMHKVINQKNNFARKSSGGGYSQPVQSQAAGSHYILSNDPNPPTLGQDHQSLAQFATGEQTPLQVAQTMAMSGHAGHYLPAIRPYMSDPMLVMRQPQVSVHAHHASRVAPRHRDRHAAAMHSASQHQPIPSSGSYSSQPVNSVLAPNSNQSRNSRGNASRNYSSEISPRFLRGQHASSATGYVYMQKGVGPNVQTVVDAPYHHIGDPKQIYPQHRSMHGVPSADSNMRSRGSPDSDKDPNDVRYQDATSDVSGADNGKRIVMSRSATLASTQPPPNGTYIDPRNRPMDQRRGMRPRRPKRDEDKPMRTSPSNVVNTPFTLESNFFPPLPGSISTTATNGGIPDGRPAAADVVKGVEASKMSPTEIPIAIVQPKKYSEVSSPSVPVPPAPQQPPKSVPVIKPSDVPEKADRVKPKPETKQGPPKAKDVPTAETNSSKPRSTQAKEKVAEKTVPVERPKVAPSNSDDVPPAPVHPSPSATVTASNAPAKKPAPATAAPGRSSSFKKGTSSKADVIAKGDSSRKDEGQTKADKPTVPPKKEVKETPKPLEKESGQPDQNITTPTSTSPTPDSNGPKPTYADMLRKKQNKEARAAAAAAAAGVALVNGKDSSDSVKSDSGDDARSSDDVKESAPTESKAPTDGPGPMEAKPHRNQHKSRGGAAAADGGDDTPNSSNDRRHDGQMHNGYGRRGGYHDNYQRGGYRTYYRDYDRRDHGYMGGRGGGYRGRGGGYRGSRRGGPRDRNYYSQSRSAPAAPAPTPDR